MMTLGDDKTTGGEEALPGLADPAESETTGLPWLRTWRGVYVLVLGCFVICLGLLAVFTAIFS
jgi:hypothetical protein